MSDTRSSVEAGFADRRMTDAVSRETVRETHRAYVASLTDGDLTADDASVIDQPSAVDDGSVCGSYSALRIEYPIPEDLVEVIWEADDGTEPTISDG